MIRYKVEVFVKLPMLSFWRSVTHDTDGLNAVLLWESCIDNGDIVRTVKHTEKDRKHAPQHRN